MCVCVRLEAVQNDKMWPSIDQCIHSKDTNDYPSVGSVIKYVRLEKKGVTNAHAQPLSIFNKKEVP